MIKKKKQSAELDFYCRREEIRLYSCTDFEYIRKHWKDTQQKNNNG